jgi:hypothetical protein
LAKGVSRVQWQGCLRAMVRAGIVMDTSFCGGERSGQVENVGVSESDTDGQVYLKGASS